MTLPTVSTVLILLFTSHFNTASFSFRDLLISLLVNPVNNSIVLINAFEFATFFNTPFLMSNCISTFASESGSISAIWNVFLTPVLLFLYWTTIIDIAGSIVFGISIGGLVSLVIISLVSFAWTVAYTECPVWIASNSTSASLFLLISPTIILSGLILNELTSRSSIETSPLPSGFGSLVTIGTQCRNFGSCTSLVSSMLTTLWFGGKKFATTLSMLVFPVAVPPLINVDSSNCTPSQIRAAASVDIVLSFMKSVIVHGFAANFLKVIVLPLTEIGSKVAFTLSPPLKWASIKGSSIVSCLPTLLPIMVA